MKVRLTKHSLSRQTIKTLLGSLLKISDRNRLRWQLANTLFLVVLVASFLPANFLVSKAYAADSSSYYLGQGLQEPCSPYRSAQVFGAALNTPNANNWNCLPTITNPGTAYNVSQISPNHEVLVALDELQNVTSATTITYQWYNSSNKLLYSYNNNIPAPQTHGYTYWSWYYVYSYIGYDSWEINANGNYRVVINNSSSATSQTINFSVSGIPPVSVASPTTSQTAINQGGSATLTDNGARGGFSPYSYQWTEQGPGQSNYSAVSGANSTSYTFNTSSSTNPGTYNFELTAQDANSPSSAATSLPVSVTVLQPTLSTTTINGMLFINNNVGNGSGDTGSITAPYLVWQGWKGSGYYLFPSRNEETGTSVSSVQELNAYNIALFSSNLGSPYTSSQFTPANLSGYSSSPSSVAHLVCSGYDVYSNAQLLTDCGSTAVAATCAVAIGATDGTAAVVETTLGARICVASAVNVANGALNSCIYGLFDKVTNTLITDPSQTASISNVTNDALGIACQQSGS